MNTIFTQFYNIFPFLISFLDHLRPSLLLLTLTSFDIFNRLHSKQGLLIQIHHNQFQLHLKIQCHFLPPGRPVPPSFVVMKLHANWFGLHLYNLPFHQRTVTCFSSRGSVSTNAINGNFPPINTWEKLTVLILSLKYSKKVLIFITALSSALLCELKAELNEEA